MGHVGVDHRLASVYEHFGGGVAGHHFHRGLQQGFASVRPVQVGAGEGLGKQFFGHLPGGRPVGPGDVLPGAESQFAHPVATGHRPRPQQQPLHPLRIFGSEGESDETPHGSAVNMGPLDVQGLHKPGQVIAPPFKRIGLFGPVAHPVAPVVVVQHPVPLRKAGGDSGIAFMGADRPPNLHHRLPFPLKPIPKVGPINFHFRHSPLLAPGPKQYARLRVV